MIVSYLFLELSVLHDDFIERYLFPFHDLLQFRYTSSCINQLRLIVNRRMEVRFLQQRNKYRIQCPKQLPSRAPGSRDS